MQLKNTARTIALTSHVSQFSFAGAKGCLGFQRKVRRETSVGLTFRNINKIFANRGRAPLRSKILATELLGQGPFRGRGKNAHDVNRKSARRYSETMILHIRHVKMHHRRFRKLLVFSS